MPNSINECTTNQTMIEVAGKLGQEQQTPIKIAGRIEEHYQTPIEIALGIDEQGRTTARKLYEFLGLHPAHYSRWCKKNIVNNQFAEENIDYWAFLINDECGGQVRSPQMVNEKYQPNQTTNYKLTASFAKKLAMASGSPRGEEAREYFLKTEEALKQIAGRRTDEVNQLKALAFDLITQNKALVQRIESLEQQQNKVLAQRLESLEQQQKEIATKIPQGFSTNERELLGQCLHQISGVLLGGNETGKNDSTLLTPEQLDNIRAAIRKCVGKQLQIIEHEYFHIPTSAHSGVYHIIQSNIHGVIKADLGVRHTKADKMHYKRILKLVEYYEMDEKLIQRIQTYIQPWNERPNGGFC